MKNKNDNIEINQEELDELRNEAIEKAKISKHKWVQKGVWLVCKSCEFRHGFYIGVDKILKGIKDGKLILEDRR